MLGGLVFQGCRAEAGEARLGGGAGSRGAYSSVLCLGEPRLALGAGTLTSVGSASAASCAFRCCVWRGQGSYFNCS